MRVTVTDANVFIDLWEMDWLNQLLALGLEIHTTSLVFHELNDKQRAAVSTIARQKLLLLMQSNQWLPRKECWDRLELWEGEE